jgi:DNA-binding FadR family transcriptional regulator
MSSQTFDTVRVPKAAEIVASTLRMQIISGTLSLDDSLPPELVLMEQFGVSRPTLREAFRILESESLIDVRRGARGGARIRVPDGAVASRHFGYILQYRGTTMSDVYKARTTLELPLGVAVAENITDDELGRLDESLERASDSLDNPIDYAEHDLEFHLLIAELSGNQTMRTMVDMLYGVVSQARRRYTDLVSAEIITSQHLEIHKTHQYFVNDIRAGARADAAKLWERHLREVELSYAARPLASTVVEMLG